MSSEISRRPISPARVVPAPAASVVGELRVPRGLEQQARAKLKRMMLRGEIGSAFNPRYEGKEYVVEYTLLRTPRTPPPLSVRITGWAAGITLGVVAIGWLLWESRYVIGAMLGIVAAIALLVWLRSMTGHRPTCVGPHCPGCRG